ncbi:MAG: sigma-70 family RNA polymerase sigma factor [Thermogemmatispora sp.]|uniref:RNA polymerase sigma factor n=1 Tax=Thermogemmatispora sp. TaxID=1968838 RepID=UPI001DD98F0E|nr:sigma-70 family RNA polymerase sigma factor [Thermogemmatispora sp.]MBX5451544.1 sigma-70 family RNA polymerase sigma factor [Thermogemmatispora sp.]
MKREPAHSGFSAVSSTEAEQWRPAAPSAEEVARATLERFLIEHTETLLQNLQFYAVRLGLAREGEARLTAQELLQEVAVEALAHAARFQPERQALAWLLGIGLNVIRRQKAERARQGRREWSVTRLAQTLAPMEAPGEWDLFDQLQDKSVGGPEELVEAREGAQALLALVDEDDRELLRLALVEDCEREALARQLGISPGAVRVRLHRALQRLRCAFRQRDASHGTRPGR